MKLFFLDCGYMTPKSKFVLQDPADPEAPFRLDVRPVLIQTGEHNILLDAGGYGSKEGWPYEPKGNFPLHIREGQRLEEQLSLCGLTPDDIDMVVLSHLHFDHMNGARLFEKATFYLPEPWRAIPEERTVLVSEDMDLVPGIRILTLPGHTAAHIGLTVELEQTGFCIFPQDAAFLAELYAPPGQIPSDYLLWNGELWFESMEKVRRLEQEHNATVFFCHDPAFFDTARHAPNYYD